MNVPLTTWEVSEKTGDLFIYFKPTSIEELKLCSIQHLPLDARFYIDPISKKIRALSLSQQNCGIHFCNLQYQKFFIHYDPKVDILSIDLTYNNPLRRHVTLAVNDDMDVIFDGYEDLRKILFIEILFASKELFVSWM